MRYIAAYLLIVLEENASPDVTSIAKILSSVGIEYDEKQAQNVIDACRGRNVEEIIAEGMKKIDGISLSNTSAIITTTIDDKTSGATKSAINSGIKSLHD
ncbi:unnamed protein product [Rotaria sp. Silwood1]|nr:unnamed protein product [Rotaria sp. Silwood1]